MSLKYSACNSRHSYTDTEIRLKRRSEPVKLSDVQKSIQSSSVNRPTRAKIRLSDLRQKK